MSDGVALFFADACSISQTKPPFRTSVHLVSHLLRDVESGLRQVLRSLPDAREYRKQRGGEPKDGKQSNRDGDKNHRLDIEAIAKALKLTERTVAEWQSYSGEESWATTTHRNDLRAPRRPDESFSLRIDRFVDVLYVVLETAEANYAVVLKAIDGVLSRSKPSAEDIAFISTHLAPGVTAMAHIFGTLSADWLPHLRDHGVFSEPPDVQRHDDGSISFPEWPQARYLARIAAARPEEVADIIESLPTVDNESVHTAFLKVAQSMPRDAARGIALREAAWLSSHTRWIYELLPRAALDLAVHLISQEEFDGATALLRAALTFGREKDRAGKPQPRISPWTFDQVVHDGVRALRLRAPDVAKDLLLSLIEAVATDRSSGWRQAVEDHQQNMMQEPLDTLFVELRDLYDDGVSAGGPAALRQAVSELEAMGRPLFARLALHLLRRHCGETADLILERVCDQDRMDSSEMFHELAALIEVRFPQLDKVSQGKVIEAIREHSSEERLAPRLAGPDERRVRQIANSQRQRWFALLGTSRPPEVEAEYRALCAEVGEPDHPTFLSWSEVRTGPNPPRTASELAALSEAELLKYLRDWVPTSSDPFEPSYRGLGREIKGSASIDPVRFSGLARSFRALHPSYVTGLLWGIHEGRQTSESRSRTDDTVGDVQFDWESVLDLVEWTVAQRDDKGEEDDQGAGDWSSARKFALEVLNDVFSVSAANSERRSRVWLTVKNLLSDTDPSARRIETNQMQDDTFVLNTVRGSALRISLAMVSRLRQSSSDPVLCDEILDEIQLRGSSKIEPSYAIRAVRARFFNTLFWLDRGRAIATASDLFPTVTEDSAERRRSWATFLKNNVPTTDVFQELDTHYRVAVELIGDMPPEAVTNLGEHLAVLAAWEVIDIDALDNLLARYVEKAPATVRRQVLAALGRILHRTKEPLSTIRTNRFKELWAWWAQRVVSTDDAEAELAAFGWWFSSNVFDIEWSMATLAQTMDRTRGTLDWDYAVAEKLANLADSSPQEVGDCLTTFVKTGTDIRINLCLSFIRSALVTLRTRGIASATTIASRLVARGWLDFRDLT